MGMTETYHVKVSLVLAWPPGLTPMRVCVCVCVRVCVTAAACTGCVKPNRPWESPTRFSHCAAQLRSRSPSRVRQREEYEGSAFVLALIPAFFGFCLLEEKLCALTFFPVNAVGLSKSQSSSNRKLWRNERAFLATSSVPILSFFSSSLHLSERGRRMKNPGWVRRGNNRVQYECGFPHMTTRKNYRSIENCRYNEQKTVQKEAIQPAASGGVVYCSKISLYRESNVSVWSITHMVNSAKPLSHARFPGDPQFQRPRVFF